MRVWCANGGIIVPLNLTDVRRIATEVVNKENPELAVVAARGERDSPYTEVILTIRGCSAEPCQLMIGVSRDATEREFREAIQDRLREHLDEHLRSLPR